MASIYAVVVAAGRSSRMGGVNKQMACLSGIPVLARSLYAMDQVEILDGIVLVAPPDGVREFTESAMGWGVKKLAAVVPGGSSRQQSVFIGLRAVPGGCGTVIIHDGARPLVSKRETGDLISAAVKYGAATLAVPVKDTVKVAGADNFVAGTPDRKKLWLTLTPQGFSFKELLEAHQAAQREGLAYTDDASLMEAAGLRVKLVAGSYSNIKITTPEDLAVAEALLKFREEKLAGIQNPDQHAAKSGTTNNENMGPI
ncbi:MAG: 2-C-methyl-D-erythritol 4-phosphate cytidylyltransferase [Bacillota bacterium]